MVIFYDRRQGTKWRGGGGAQGTSREGALNSGKSGGGGGGTVRIACFFFFSAPNVLAEAGCGTCGIGMLVYMALSRIMAIQGQKVQRLIPGLLLFYSESCSKTSLKLIELAVRWPDAFEYLLHAICIVLLSPLQKIRAIRYTMRTALMKLCSLSL